MTETTIQEKNWKPDVNPWLIARGEWKNISQLRTEFDFVNGKWQYVIQSPVEN